MKGKKSLKKFLDRKMDRKEFLVFLGLVALTVTGVSGIMKNLSNINPVEVKKRKVTQGFGTGPYGI
jgi:hypothetical protein